MENSVYEVFGVVSPVADTKKILVGDLAPMGQGSNISINDGYVFEYKTLRRILRNIRSQKPTWIHGPSGCGKTELVSQVACRLKRQCHVLSMGEETSIRELLGTFELVPGESGTKTRFKYGSLTAVMQEPHAIIVLDEFNMAPSTVAAQFNRLLETGEIKIPETGEVVKAAEGVCFFVTANTAGGGDESGLYAGSQIQNGATRSRFAGLRVTYMDPKEEVKILRKAYPRLDASVENPASKKTTSELMVQTAGLIRGLVEERQVSLPFTVRNLLEWGDSTLSFQDIREAFRNAYYDMLDGAELVAVDEVFQRVFTTRVEDN